MQKYEEMPQNHEVLTKKEAAKHCKVSERTIDRWRSTGLIPSKKMSGLVRFSKADLDAVFKTKTN